jgi:hypothetical protein
MGRATRRETVRRDAPRGRASTVPALGELRGSQFQPLRGGHNRPGNDGGCFESALDSIHRCGGVIEHPAGSNAWVAFGLPRPLAHGWAASNVTGEWVCEVWQSAYGHKARKRTWLIYVGKRPPFELDWSRNPGTHQVGWFDRIKPTLSKSEASRTPAAFADVLIALARQST